MSFKSFLQFSTAVCLSVATLGCSEYLRGPKKQDDVLQVETKETQCLKTMPEFLNNYFEDKTTSAETSGNITCLRLALKTFTRFTTGASPDLYTQAELQHFLNRYLLEDNKISDPFMDEIMKIKVLAVGGSQRSFTRFELDQFAQYMSAVEAELVRLNGHWKTILFKNEVDKVTAEEITEISKLLKSAVLKLVFESKASSSGYEFEDIQSFFAELNHFMATKDSRLSTLIKWLPVMKSVKLTFMGEYLKIASRTEWKEQIDWAVDSYSLGLNYYYILKNQSYQKPASWDTALTAVDQTFDLLQRSPVLKSQGVLQSRNIDHMMDEFFRLDIVPLSISGDLMKSTYKKILFHWLDEKKGNALDEIRGFEERHLSIIRTEYEIWKQAQIGINQAFSVKSEYTTSEFLKHTKKQGPPKVFNADSINVRKDQLTSSWNEWIEILSRPRVPALDQDQKLSVSYSGGSEKQNFLGLSISNALRSVVRFWLKGYGDHSDRNIFHTSMNVQGIVDLEVDFHDFGIAVGFLDPRSPNAPVRTFKEANFFTFSGNGDDRMDAFETYELLHFMVSAGFFIADDMDVKLKAEKCNVSNLDFRGKNKSTIDCFKQSFIKNMDRYLSAAPAMAQFMAKIKGTPEFDIVFANLVAIAREDNAEQGLTEYSELRTFASLLQYVESLFVQYDLDASQGLSVDELLVAEPRFHQFIKSLSPIKADSFVREVFLFMVMEGKTPPTKLSEVDSRLLTYGFRRVFGTRAQADRLKLFNVLGVLKNAP